MIQHWLQREEEMEQLKYQSRIWGEGVDLGLFPSDSLKSQPYEFDEITHKGL